MSAILGLDTATADTVAAVWARGETLAEVAVGPGDDGRPRHATALMEAIEKAVAEAGGWGEIDRLAVGLGPGSFTGMRIGIATARALAQGRGLPISGVASTAALAATLLDEYPDRACLGVIDARRGEVFAELWGSEINAADGPVVSRPGDLTGALPGARGGLACGDGSLRFRDELEAEGIEVLADEHPAHRISAAQVCALADKLEAGDPASIRPNYLRRPDAERWLERDRGDN